MADERAERRSEVFLRYVKARAEQTDWSSVLRNDPCAYCGGHGGTVDHIDPRSQKRPASGRRLTGCCSQCNNARGTRPLLWFLIVRAAIFKWPGKLWAVFHALGPNKGQPGRKWVTQ